MSDRHIVVVGGGIIGLSCAHYLLERGARVTIIERDGFTDGASTGNAGIIAPGHLPLPHPGLPRRMLRVLFSKTNPLYIKPRMSGELLRWLWEFWRACSFRQLERSMEVLSELGRVSDECFSQLHEDEGIDAEYTRNGRLEVFRTDRGRLAASEVIELSEMYGFSARELSASELNEREPCFIDGVQGAALFEDGGFASPGKFVQELADHVREKGAEMLERGKVVDVHVREDAVRGVGLANGTKIEADSVVLAAGIWTTRLGRQIGVEIPMQAGKGYHLELEGVPAAPKTTTTLIETFVAATPMSGRLRLAGTVELSGINDRMVRKRLDMLLIGARQYIDGIDEARVVDEWVGMRPMTADGLPVIGPVSSIRGLYIATGHSMMGFMLGPGTGKVMSELILDGATEIDVSALSADRF